MKYAILAWDIGGAHLKNALIVGHTEPYLFAKQRACPLWQGIDVFTRTAQKALQWAQIQTGNQPLVHYATMTGELADCFLNRKQGVQQLSVCLYQLLAPTNAPLMFYDRHRGLLPYADAQHHPLSLASSNWHITAESTRQLYDKTTPLLLIDIGSTTTDMTLIKNHTLKNQGDDDQSRLQNGELVYSGISRTPLLAFGPTIDVAGTTYPLCAELFATMADVYRVHCQLHQDDDQHKTADGEDKSPAASRRRIARMVGLDQDHPSAFLDRLVQAFRDKQRQQIVTACLRLLARHDCAIEKSHMCFSGAGAFLATEIAQNFTPPIRYSSWADKILSAYQLRTDDKISIDRCAPAVALAVLAKNASKRAKCETAIVPSRLPVQSKPRKPR